MATDISTADLYVRLEPIFQDILDNDDLTLTPELNADDVDEWDSLSHIRLIVAIEQELGIQFSSIDVDGLENVGQFVALVKRKL